MNGSGWQRMWQWIGSGCFSAGRILMGAKCLILLSLYYIFSLGSEWQWINDTIQPLRMKIYRSKDISSPTYACVVLPIRCQPFFWVNQLI
jgi:hypothetical protein